MTQEQVIIISPKGELTFLTHGDDDLLGAGDTRIVRASHIRFSNTEQLWFVYIRFCSGKEEKLRPGFEGRKAALAKEVEVCNAMLCESPHLVGAVIRSAGVLDIEADDSSG